MSSSVLDHPREGAPADSSVALTRPDDLVAALGAFCRAVHSEPVDPESVDCAATATLANLERRVADGAVDSSGFDASYSGQTAARLLGIAHDLWDRYGAGWHEDAPVTGYRLGELMVDNGRVCGWPPGHRPKRGDRYFDLALLARDLSVAIGPAAVPALFDSYGEARPDPARVEFWVLCAQLL